MEKFANLNDGDLLEFIEKLRHAIQSGHKGEVKRTGKVLSTMKVRTSHPRPTLSESSQLVRIRRSRNLFKSLL
jgi:hypothetical protein